MATTETKLDILLVDVRELGDFLYTLLPALDEQKLRQGDNVLRYAKNMKLKIPKSLSGVKITWESNHSDSLNKHGSKSGESLVLMRPGDPNTVGLTIKCVKIKDWKVCLECGWLYCRIVVTKRF